MSERTLRKKKSAIDATTRNGVPDFSILQLVFTTLVFSCSRFWKLNVLCFLLQQIPKNAQQVETKSKVFTNLFIQNKILELDL